MNPSEFRKKVAKREITGPTAGYCNNFLQTNMIVLPKEYAKSFERFAKQNPKAIPVLEIINGSHYSKRLAPGANLLNELPSYNIYIYGELVKTVTDIEEYFNDDLVFFLVGCSFTFESALIENGISLRHVNLNMNVSMYNTNIDLVPVDNFHGKMVVSMRPIKKDRVADTCVITAHYPSVHGSPIHIGHPYMIGIHNIFHPDYGSYIDIKEDEIPVFWPCGVTSENVIQNIKLPFAITHTPGHMLITDKKDEDYYVSI